MVEIALTKYLAKTLMICLGAVQSSNTVESKQPTFKPAVIGIDIWEVKSSFNSFTYTQVNNLMREFLSFAKSFIRHKIKIKCSKNQPG